MLAEAAPRFLLVPAVRRGGGTGHLRRCLRLARELGAEAQLRLELPPGEDPRALLQSFGYDPDRIRWISASPVLPGAPAGRGTPAGPSIVLLDRRSTSRAELADYRRLGTVVGLDEGGAARRLVPFLADSLSMLPGASPANLFSAVLLDLPPRCRTGPRDGARRVLVSFGGEDTPDLSGRLLRRLLAEGLFCAAELTVVAGPRFGDRRWPEGVRRLDAPPDLRERLRGFDLVFTQFGLTVFEALAAGVPVICLNPTGYHRRLCRAAGLPEIGLRRPAIRRLRAVLADPASLEARVERFQAERPEGAGGPAEMLRGLRFSGNERCPVCGESAAPAPGDPAVARSPARTCFTCRRCGLIYLLSCGGAEKRYGSAYFFEEYRAQYGRTYLEDFDAIRRTGLERLQVIERLLVRAPSGPPPAGRPPGLLDVGCALGPFLQAARERGFSAAGVDVSPEAVVHVTGVLGLPAACLDFQAAEPGDGGGLLAAGRYDAVTFWYVIEHFHDLRRVLERARRLLKPGGVLALATPNAKGISGRRDPRRFLLAGPADHFTVWSPRSARRALARCGFRVERVRVTGHHPERFPRLAAGFVPAPLRPRILMAASRLFGLGDTFEAYARKVEEADGR